ncbi:hypothetical protein GFS60_06228 (plasmid) [Rhodococcus sp. WAY2]|nr:hypothetical protein GFS60_06228 [Rhodococcus sp. WAY2]
MDRGRTHLLNGGGRLVRNHVLSAEALLDGGGLIRAMTVT